MKIDKKKHEKAKQLLNSIKTVIMASRRKSLSWRLSPLSEPRRFQGQYRRTLESRELTTKLHLKDAKREGTSYYFSPK